MVSRTLQSLLRESKGRSTDRATFNEAVMRLSSVKSPKNGEKRPQRTRKRLPEEGDSYTFRGGEGAISSPFFRKVSWLPAETQAVQPSYIPHAEFLWLPTTTS